MQILNALQLKAGAKVNNRGWGSVTRPFHFIPEVEKTCDWAHEMVDWYEDEGMRQIKAKSKKYMKDYMMSEGLIDPSDYMMSEENEYSDLINILSKDDGESPFSIRFYPIVPVFIRAMLAELAKRKSKVTFRGTDRKSYNERKEAKRAKIEEILLQRSQAKQMEKMMASGYEPTEEEMAQAMSPDVLKALPEVERFFRKDYQSLYEEWANVQMRVDSARFNMDELEVEAFRDKLTVNEQYFHFKMLEDDYDIEVWDPRITFKHKSPGKKYTSSGNYVGKIELLTISDVVDEVGYLMSPEQLKSLEQMCPSHSAMFGIDGIRNDGSLYDPSKSYEWNTSMPSVAMRSHLATSRKPTGDIMEQIMREDTDMWHTAGNELLRRTTVYWKTFRELFELTRIDTEGNQTTRVVTADYVITDKPLYNKFISTDKTKDTLIFGEHLESIFIPEVWGAQKIGLNKSAGLSRDGQQDPTIYLGIDKNKPGRLKFQFKGEHSLYGAKLPVEGWDDTTRTTKKNSFTRLLAPYQVQYNMVNNQIADILVDELGTVILLDQNSLPKHSMGEDWGKGNLAKAYVAMKDFQMLPLDTSVPNTETPLNFSHYQVLNLEQTNRLMSRVNLANYFMQKAMEVIGYTPQRMGMSQDRQTAKGVEETMAASHTITEMWFIEHCDMLMPRVHQMRTDLAQYYHSAKRSVRLQYMTDTAEEMLFEMDGTDMHTRQINVYAVTNFNHRELMQEIKNIIKSNNQNGSSIYDLGTVLRAETISELDSALMKLEERVQQNLQDQRGHEKELEDMRIQADAAKDASEKEYESSENMLDRESNERIAEVRAAGMGAMVDINENKQNDYLDAMEVIRKKEEFSQKQGLDREKMMNQSNQFNRQMSMKEREIQSRENIAEKNKQVAVINKNKHDTPAKKK